MMTSLQSLRRKKMTSATTSEENKVLSSVCKRRVKKQGARRPPSRAFVRKSICLLDDETTTDGNISLEDIEFLLSPQGRTNKEKSVRITVTSHEEVSKPKSNDAATNGDQMMNSKDAQVNQKDSSTEIDENDTKEELSKQLFLQNLNSVLAKKNSFKEKDSVANTTEQPKTETTSSKKETTEETTDNVIASDQASKTTNAVEEANEKSNEAVKSSKQEKPSLHASKTTVPSITRGGIRINRRQKKDELKNKVEKNKEESKNKVEAKTSFMKGRGEIFTENKNKEDIYMSKSALLQNSKQNTRSRLNTTPDASVSYNSSTKPVAERSLSHSSGTRTTIGDRIFGKLKKSSDENEGKKSSYFQSRFGVRRK